MKLRAPWLALAAGALLLLAPGAASAQQLAPDAGKALGRARAVRTAPGPAVTTPQSTPRSAPQSASGAAGQRNPERVRDVLRSVHGFSRAALDAASADVPAVLEALIDAPGESPLVRRQAVKALGLYPGAGTLAFVQGHLDAAPLGLRRIYLSTLVRFGAMDAATVSTLLERGLNDADVTVRWAAADSAAALARLAPVQAVLARHAGTESDPALRSALTTALDKARQGR